MRGLFVAALVTLTAAAPAGAADLELLASASGSCTTNVEDTYVYGPVPESPSGLTHRLTVTSGRGIWDSGGLSQDVGPNDVAWDSESDNDGGGMLEGSFHCQGGPGSYQVDTFRTPAPPASFSGKTTFGSDSSVRLAPTYRAGLAVDITLTQGTVTVCGAGTCRTVGSAGTLLLPHRDPIFGNSWYLTVSAQDGPQAIWSISARSLPVSVTGLRLDRTLVRPGDAVRADYNTNGDTSITSTVFNAAGGSARTLAGGLAVGLGSHSLTWDGFDAAGGPLPDGPYTFQVAGRDPANNPTSQGAQVTLDGTGPTGQQLSLAKMPATNALAVQVTDQFAGIKEAQLIVGGRIVDNFPSPVSSPARLSYRPENGWRPGSSFGWRLAAKDGLDNVATTTGSFKTLETPLSTRQAEKDVKRVFAARNLHRRGVRKLGVSCKPTGRSSARCRYSLNSAGFFGITGKGSVGRHHGKRTFDLKIRVKRSGGGTFPLRFTHRNRQVLPYD